MSGFPRRILLLLALSFASQPLSAESPASATSNLELKSQGELAGDTLPDWNLSLPLVAFTNEPQDLRIRRIIGLTLNLTSVTLLVTGGILSLVPGPELAAMSQTFVTIGAIASVDLASFLVENWIGGIVYNLSMAAAVGGMALATLFPQLDAGLVLTGGTLLVMTFLALKLTSVIHAATFIPERVREQHENVETEIFIDTPALPDRLAKWIRPEPRVGVQITLRF